MIYQAKEAWDSLARFRKNRDRCRDYTFGRQWNDRINVCGRMMTEYEYIVREGNVPLKNNLIRRVVRNVLGNFRRQVDQLMEGYEGELLETARRNSLKELFCRTMEEFLISGMAVHRKGFGFCDGKHGVWTHAVSPGSFFYNNTARDVRGWDIDLAGEIHEVDFRQWCSAFVNGRKSYEKARKFFERSGKTRKVVELWRKELVPDADAPGVIATTGTPERGWRLREVWKYYFLTDDGTVIKSGESPYAHGGHPYVFRFYPFLDGEIQSFVGDLIDQQRYANRLITLYDWVVRASAKGVLLIPEGSVAPENYQAMADQWGRFNGVIVYKAQPGMPEPHQVNAAGAHMGISELLEIQLKMLEDVSGVNGALQGNLSSNSVSGTLYSQQTENARTSLFDIMETFGCFIRDSLAMDMSLLHQIKE